MKTLHSYLTRQMLATLGMTVFVFTLVLLLANVIEGILIMLVRRQITPIVALHALGLLLPYVLAFSLPIGMLTAALLVFGRFSAEQELTAARASGISLLSLIWPVLLLSVVVSALCGWLNCQVAPASRMAYKELIYSAARARHSNLVQSGQTSSFPGFSIWAGSVKSDGTNLENIVVTQYDSNGAMHDFVSADTGCLTIIPGGSNTPDHLSLDLSNAARMTRRSDPSTGRWGGWEGGGIVDHIPLGKDIPAEVREVMQTPYSDMTFHELLDKREEIRKTMGLVMGGNITTAEIPEMQARFRKITKTELSPVNFYLHNAAAFSFACVGFTMVGIPLGIRAHRRETSIGVATALGLMLLYYSFIALGQAWSAHPERFPCFIVWVPNLLFQSVGVFLLWRANRGV